MAINDTIVALRQVAAPFLGLAKVIDDLEKYASLDNWRAEAEAAKDKALAQLSQAKAEATALEAKLAAKQAEAQAAVSAHLRDAEQQAAGILTLAIEKADKHVGTAAAKAAEAHADQLETEAVVAALSAEVERLTSTRDALRAEIAALKARFEG